MWSLMNSTPTGGAFGAHLANIFRRMKRVCGYYGSKPQFLCSSATIANPAELAERICGEKFVLVDKDGSAAPEKEYRLLLPPEIKGKNDKIYGRRPASWLAAELVPALAAGNHHFIVFGKSRRNVEVILKEARDKMEENGISRKIAGYRGGYTPVERKSIEEKMITGELAGLVSTNALELGIDIGSLGLYGTGRVSGNTGFILAADGKSRKKRGKMRKLSYPGKSAF